MAKRGDGEGSVRRRPDGRWEARVSLGFGPDGRAIRRSVYGATRREVIAKGAELQAPGATLPTAWQVGTRTVHDLCLRWLEHKRDAIRSTSLARYETVVRLHLDGEFGAIPVDALRADHIRALYASKLRTARGGSTPGLAVRPLSPRTVRYVHTVLHQALAQAVRDGDLERNVATLVVQPRLERREVRPLDPAQMASLLDAAGSRALEARPGRDTRAWRSFRAFLVVALHTGAREGELLALDWQDVVLDGPAPAIAIRRTVVRLPGGGIAYHPPKTVAGRRSVSLSAPAATALRSLGPAEGLVFATSTGAPVGATAVIRWFREVASQAGLPPGTRVHDLRHAFASTALARGVDLASLARILGHANPQVTATVYAHALPDLTGRSIARATEALPG